MGALRHRRRRQSAALALFIFAAALGSAQVITGVAQDQVGDARINLPEREQQERRLSGLGSSPPTCRARCGRCFPCRPVHVTIHPGRISPLEYYPEAWRCKCGNKFFMP